LTGAALGQEYQASPGQILCKQRESLVAYLNQPARQQSPPASFGCYPITVGSRVAIIEVYPPLSTGRRIARVEVGGAVEGYSIFGAPVAPRPPVAAPPQAKLAPTTPVAGPQATPPKAAPVAEAPIQQVMPQAERPATIEPAKAAPAAPRFSVVDAADLGVGTRKYMNRDIEVRNVGCYYADVDDYRCVASVGIGVAIFAAAIQPAPAQEYVEKKCDTLSKSITQACRLTVRFRYSQDDVHEDIISGFQKRTVIKLNEISASR